jgi:hypothetical protein
MKLIDLFKKNKALIIIVGLLLILILMRATGMNHFRNDAKKWAMPSVNQTNLITSEQLDDLAGEHMIISLDKSFIPEDFKGELDNIAADSVLSREHIRKILKHEGPVAIYSSDPGLSARIWMLLSQMGRDELYILTENDENEIMKFDFQADSIK